MLIDNCFIPINDFKKTNKKNNFLAVILGPLTVWSGLANSNMKK